MASKPEKFTGNRIEIAALSAAQSHAYLWEPDAATRQAIAADLGLLELRKLRAQVTLTPAEDRDWLFEAAWGATVVQPCVVTLAPVVTRLEETGQLHLTTQMPEVTEAEAEMPEDDTLEPLTPEIDLPEKITEMIALSLPPYPRAPDAALDNTVFGPPDTAPMTDDDAKPFASLAELRAKMGGGDG